jgi:hypothetical protein
MLRVVGGVRLTHRASGIFVHPALDLTHCVKKGVFSKVIRS